MPMRKLTTAIAVMVLVAAIGACAKKTPPIARPVPPPPAADPGGARPPLPPTPVPEPQPIPPEPTLAGGDLASKDIDDINRNSPFQPVFYVYDQFDVDAAGQQALNGNVDILRKYPSWIITIEGHADERGTAEYNLALGERRALSARNYLVSLGIPADRLRTGSSGKEFPFDPGHTEASWAKNRRAHFVVTSKDLRGFR
jgi:peptidoglycan-associated lipoprotein